jgi:hypothetical protein
VQTDLLQILVRKMPGLTGDDRAVEEEAIRRDLGMKDMARFAEEYNQKYRSDYSTIDWARITNFGLVGGLFG